ncbi:helix-turn-helix domain-containing protein [Modestobacter sp. DSM 44400]|uniref:helix-turn-helix domain-containing protein n=1 Tax=Modestobacter sp. DSM 44400 TaxID=1550230 RepID=UPI000B83E07F|nr:XRE family transcriptional regulator [Modestobacter sp. DSM 44400]
MADVPGLGRNVRRIRGERRLSIGALAHEAGLAKQTIANLESGTGNPTVETLIAVARALGVGVTWLLTEWGSPVSIQRSADATWEQIGTVRLRSLDRIHGSGQVDTAVVELDCSREVRAALSPGTLLHAYVLSGAVLAGPADDAHLLEERDFIRFPGDVPHALRASAGTAVVHLVTTVPLVRQFSPD